MHEHTTIPFPHPQLITEDLWCAKILSSCLWTIFHPPETISTKAYRFQL